MTDISRKWYMRVQAIEALELTKGFTPEERAHLSNGTKTMEEFAGYILELTNDLDDENIR
jgi:hypothetical protein